MSAIGLGAVHALPFNVTFQPGSTPAAPVTVAIPLGDVYAYSVEIEVPDGPSGNMGFYLLYAGVPIVPYAQTPTFLVVDDYEHTFPIAAELASSLNIVGYNTGYWPHTVYMRFLATPISAYAGNLIIPPTSQLDLSGLGVS